MWDELDGTEPEWLDDDPTLDELTQVEDADDLCRLLLGSPPWGSSSSHYAEAVDLLTSVHDTGTLPTSFVALLLCTCPRWRRVTAKLIAAIERSGLLNGADLDDLADALISEQAVIEYPLAWVSPQWLEVDLSDGTTEAVTVDEDTMATTERHSEPPLRRWAAARALRNDPGRIDDLLGPAEKMAPHHRDALLHGLLDAADALEKGDRRRLVGRALRSGVGRVRRDALDRLCELDGPEAAQRRAASDADRTVRAWRPPAPPASAPGQSPDTIPLG